MHFKKENSSRDPGCLSRASDIPGSLSLASAFSSSQSWASIFSGGLSWTSTFPGGLSRASAFRAYFFFCLSQLPVSGSHLVGCFRLSFSDR